MKLWGLTATNISNTVWAQATRSLTNAGFDTITAAANQSLAITTQFNFQPASGKIRIVTVAVSLIAGGAGNVTIELNDGTNIFVLATAAPGATAFVQHVLSSNAVFLRVNNQNNTNPAKYAYSFIEETV